VPELRRHRLGRERDRRGVGGENRIGGLFEQDDPDWPVVEEFFDIALPDQCCGSGGRLPAAAGAKGSRAIVVARALAAGLATSSR
jgi:hypothetical protein